MNLETTLVLSLMTVQTSNQYVDFISKPRLLHMSFVWQASLKEAVGFVLFFR